MKRIGKRILSTFLCGIMVFSMVACGKEPVNTTAQETEAEEMPSLETEVKLNYSVSEERLKELYDGIMAESDSEAEPLTEEELLLAEQMNSYSMMYYLAITSEEIRTSKENRLVLEEIHTSLLNNTNPSAIDEKTQEHLEDMIDIIHNYIDNSKKRERLEYLFNQQKSAAMKQALPNPIDIFTIVSANKGVKAIDWVNLVVAVSYTAADSVAEYNSGIESAERQYLISGWQLDDEQEEAVRKNRDHAFKYMVDMVQEYHLDGKLTLSEKKIEEFVEICKIEKIPEKIKRLESEKESYQLLGNYWIELADCYFENAEYDKCLECVIRYKELSTGIYRQDLNYVKVLPKAIVSAQALYSGDEYVTIADKLSSDIVSNTSTTDWVNRYFVAQVYIDLYKQTKNRDYLNTSYNIISDNVTVLLKDQREMNNLYLNDVEKITVQKPDYKYLNDEQKKAKKAEYKKEKKQANSYNKIIQKARKTELPALYEPLVINCELLFALSKEIGIDDQEKKSMDAIMDDTFISDPVRNFYYFYPEAQDYEGIDITKKAISIPANLLTSESEVTINIIEKNGSNTIIDDLAVKKVKREGEELDTFKAKLTSDSFKKYEWTADSVIEINIVYKDAFDKSIKMDYEVTDYQKKGPFETVKFGKKE